MAAQFFIAPTYSRRGRLPRAVFVLSLLLIVCGSARAQVCFRGRPMETCSWFFVTEFGVRYNFTRNNAGSGFTNHLTAPITVGWMKNLDAQRAFGGTISLDPDTEFSDWFFSLGPRYRTWLSRDSSLDAMASLTLGNGSFRNVNVQAVWMYRDLVGVDLGIIFDMVNDGYERQTIRPFVGVRAGSYPGVVAYALTALAFALYSGAYSD